VPGYVYYNTDNFANHLTRVTALLVQNCRVKWHRRHQQNTHWFDDMRAGMDVMSWLVTTVAHIRSWWRTNRMSRLHIAEM